MKNLKLYFGLVLFGLLTSGCSHKHVVEGVQEKMEVPAGVRVTIGSSEVVEGDKVDIYRTQCKKKHKDRIDLDDDKVCSNIRLGQGIVTKILSENVAIIQPPQGLEVDREMWVEKSTN